jgi:hypothetical protein
MNRILDSLLHPSLISFANFVFSVFGIPKYRNLEVPHLLLTGMLSSPQNAL